jgi:hypothetical protein
MGTWWKDCVMTKRHFFGGGDLLVRKAVNQRDIAEFYARFGRVPPLAFNPHPEARRLLAEFALVEGSISAHEVGFGERFATMPMPTGTLQ